MRTGKAAQNPLTIVKVIGLAGLLIIGSVRPLPQPPASCLPKCNGPGFSLAMVFVLYAFDSWNDSVFVAAEAGSRSANVPRALVLGLAIVTGVSI